MRKILVTALLLLGVTTPLAVWSFRLYYGDFFYLREVYRNPGEADRERLLNIAGTLDYYDRRNVAMSMMLGEALMRVGEKERALRIMRVAQGTLFPDDPGILRALADALAGSGETEKADEIYRKLMEYSRGGAAALSEEDSQ